MLRGYLLQFYYCRNLFTNVNCNACKYLTFAFCKTTVLMVNGNLLKMWLKLWVKLTNQDLLSTCLNFIIILPKLDTIPLLRFIIFYQTSFFNYKLAYPISNRINRYRTSHIWNIRYHHGTRIISQRYQIPSDYFPKG